MSLPILSPSIPSLPFPALCPPPGPAPKSSYRAWELHQWVRAEPSHRTFYLHFELKSLCWHKSTDRPLIFVKIHLVTIGILS